MGASIGKFIFDGITFGEFKHLFASNKVHNLIEGEFMIFSQIHYLSTLQCFAHGKILA